MGRRLWRWFFPTVLIGIVLPMGLLVTILAAKSEHIGGGRLFRNGELFLFAVAVLASGRSYLGDSRETRSEIMGDVMVALIALATGCWTTIVGFQIVGDTVVSWLPTWGGVTVLGIALLLAGCCVVSGSQGANESQEG